jgi:hypothetical protein
MTDLSEDLAYAGPGIQARLVQQDQRGPVAGPRPAPRRDGTASPPRRDRRRHGLDIIPETDLFRAGGERLAAALTAAEDCRDEVLRLRSARRRPPAGDHLELKSSSARTTSTSRSRVTGFWV